MADAEALHRALVDGLISRRCITDPRVEAAFRAVPRHLFLPSLAPEEAYRNVAIPTKLVNGEAVSSSSQPEIMATMLEQLGLEPGHRVLEIGAGTGYNAALMAHLVGSAGEVTTIDLDEDLVDGARAHLASAGFDRVRVELGDGALGCPAAAPFDRIILTVGAWDISPAWRRQLGRNGRLVLPLAVAGTQKSIAFAHAGDGLASLSVRECLFMPLRGAFAASPPRVALGDGPGLHLYVSDPAGVDPVAAHTLVKGAPADHSTGVRATGSEVYAGLVPWTALRESEFCWLEATGAEADAGAVPYLYGVAGKYRSAAGVFEGTSAGFFMRPPSDAYPSEPEPEPKPFELYVRGFGDGALDDRLRQHARAWDAAGRPTSSGLRIRALPIDATYAPNAGEHVVEKRWTRLVLDWPRNARDKVQ
ncbi:MAG: methyltransferase, FxLD system [Candidatus Rokuibacteriota bacterium]|nr:MAG: methyltransferase, FxLD system [Candidatus Rokubacteria bacterium]